MDYQHQYYLSRREEFKARYRQNHPIKPKKPRQPKPLTLQKEIKRRTLKEKLENIEKIKTKIILNEDLKINFD